MKKTKIKPVLIHSRDGMLAVVAELVSDKLALKELQIQIEQQKAAIDARYQERVDELARQIQMAEGGLHVWSDQNPGEFDGKKSIDLPSARFGFRLCPPKVEKGKGVKNFDEVLARLASTVVQDACGQPVFIGENFIRDGSPSIDKERLIAERANIPAAAFKAAGFTIDQDEVFFFEPKSEVLEASSREAA